jgi:hypothetical protein
MLVSAGALSRSAGLGVVFSASHKVPPSVSGAIFPPNYPLRLVLND